MGKDEYISTSVAARHYVFKSILTVQRMCQAGVLKSARKIGVGKQARWQIRRSELLQLIAKSTQTTE